jgi:hypothetical protein
MRAKCAGGDATGRQIRPPVDEWRPVDEQIAMPAESVPALVDQETFEIVQERLRLNRERSARNNREPEATRYLEKRTALDALGVMVKVWRSDHTPRWEAEASIPLSEGAEATVCWT